MLWEDAIGVAMILVETDRAVHPGKWIDSLVNQDEAERLEGWI